MLFEGKIITNNYSIPINFCRIDAVTSLDFIIAGVYIVFIIDVEAEADRGERQRT